LPQALAIAFSVMVKVVKIVSYIGPIKALLDDGLSQLPHLAGREPWQAVRPFGNTPAEVTFTQDEAAFILSTKEKRLMLATLELGDCYNDFLHMIALYSGKRETLTAALPVGAMTGNMAPSHLDAEALTRLRPQMFHVPAGTQFVPLRGTTPNESALERIADSGAESALVTLGADENAPAKPANGGTCCVLSDAVGLRRG
jgi:hypothetical protein